GAERPLLRAPSLRERPRSGHLRSPAPPDGGRPRLLREEGRLNIERGSLSALTGALHTRVELTYKQDIQLAAKAFGREARSAWFPEDGPIVNGDDATALAHAGGYVLFAAEGMRGDFVEKDPWFAGYCSILAN